jgi:hypothetical protein
MSSSFACNSRALARRGATLVLGLGLGSCLGLLPLACRTVDAGTSLRIEVPEADRDADLFVDGH